MSSKCKGNEQGEVHDEEMCHIGCAINDGLDHHVQSRICCERLKEAQNQGHKIQGEQVSHKLVIVADFIAHSHDVVQNSCDPWNAHDPLQLNKVQILASDRAAASACNDMPNADHPTAKQIATLQQKNSYSC